MLHAKRFRACAFLLLLGLLATPVFGRDAERTETVKERSVFSWFWHALSELVHPIVKSRGTMDPDGKPAPTVTAPATEGDSRGSMDPNG